MKKISNDFKKYKRTGTVLARPVTKEECQYEGEQFVEIYNISMSPENIAAGSPLPGDMVAVNPEDDKDQWLITADYFEKNFEKTGE